MNYETILEAYTLQEILEYNDLTEAECLEYLVDRKFISIPDYVPLNYD